MREFFVSGRTELAGNHTDHQNGMVLCAVTATPCVVLGNSYHKVKACHDWLQSLPYICFIDQLGCLEEAIDAVCSVNDTVYPEAEMQALFDPLISEIQCLLEDAHE